MSNFRIAVKAFIVDQGKVLLLRRRSDDVHKPGSWDIPGGRLEVGEDPFEGLRREVKEEVQMEVKIEMPLHIQHFQRDDGQYITMIIFLCSTESTSVQLSEEHQEYIWADVIFEKEKIPEWLHEALENLSKVRM